MPRVAGYLMPGASGTRSYEAQRGAGEVAHG